MASTEPIELLVVTGGFAASEVYPNPLTPASSLVFGLDQPDYVTVDMYDAVVRRVKRLFKGRPDANAPVRSTYLRKAFLQASI